MCIISPRSLSSQSVGHRGDLDSLNWLELQPHVLRPHSTHVYPAREVEANANCSDEATWEYQTSVFNTDDRLACREFSHPTKQAPFLLYRTGAGRLCLAFLTESWGPQTNGLSEGNKESTKLREGDGSRHRRWHKGRAVQ